MKFSLCAGNRLNAKQSAFLRQKYEDGGFGPVAVPSALVQLTGSGLFLDGTVAGKRALLFIGHPDSQGMATCIVAVEEPSAAVDPVRQIYLDEVRRTVVLPSELGNVAPFESFDAPFIAMAKFIRDELPGC